ncbi:TPR domain protein [Penicillium cosmopolitanum]|uniref:TPR domain protein n=1 Tax=Penicillium cosmopolitanum TaxID=1131564 RepID=A0A9W9W0S2_9EURO|nr:TPR domain protein [Penicillium cosmopolitanum]KAJ5396593.1 TPR domain protein [Penicillium cosmopolitanum]
MTKPVDTGLMPSFQSFFPLEHLTDGISHMGQMINAVQDLKGRPIGMVSMKELVGYYMQHQVSNSMKGILVQLTFETTPYEPCIHPMSSLTKTTISDLRYNTRHEGSYILLRLITGLDITGTLFAIAEDENQRVIPVQLFNQNSLPGNELLEIYSAFIVKEPLVEVVGWGEVGIRVDHASDFKCISRYSEDLPAGWKKSIKEKRTVAQWKAVATELYKTGLYAQAVECYSKALEIPSPPGRVQTLRFNRAQALCKLGRSEETLLDLGILTPAMQSYDTALYRKARTFYDLRQYRKSSEVLSVLCKAYPKNPHANRMFSESIKRLLEEKTGMYSFKEMQTKLLARHIVRLEYATYIGPIEVRPASVTGRGLFSSQDVKAGELLLCEKAMAYFSEEDASKRMLCRGYRVGLDSAKAMPLARVELVHEMVRELRTKPSWMADFMNMYHDSYKSTVSSFHDDDGGALVDSFLVHKVMVHNMLHSDTCTRDTYVLRSESKSVFEEERSDFAMAQQPPCGIWRMASFANHSCLLNAQHSFIGDMLIMRATMDIAAGTEILIRYRERATDFLKASKWNPFEDRGFACTCDLCQSIDYTDERILKLREAVLRDLQLFVETVFIESRPGKVEVGDLMMKMNTLLATYEEIDVYLPRLSVFEIKYALTRIFDVGGLPYAAAGLAVECFMNLGYSLTGAITMENQVVSGPLAIEKWGMLDYRLVKCWLILARSYRIMAPHLEHAAKDYAMLFYKMVVGEDHSFNSAYKKMMS